MPTTKKLIVRFDVNEKEPFSGDFLIPRFEDGVAIFRGMKSGEIGEYGMVVYIGKDVNENDLFARLVDSGVRIPIVDETLSLLAKFLDAMKTVKIGNVVELELSDGEVKLTVAAKSPSGFGK